PMPAGVQIQRTPNPLLNKTIALGVGLGINGILILVLTYFLFRPIFQGSPEPPGKIELTLPGYRVADWRAVPVQHGGSYKPCESAAIEVLRLVHGRSTWQKQDAVAVVLSWMMQEKKWDDQPFILCEHEELRRLIFTTDFNGTQLKAEPKFEEIHAK